MSEAPARPAAARRALGALLLVLLVLPWYRLVGGPDVGPAAQQTLRLGGGYLGALWLGVVLTALGVLALGWVVPPRVATALRGALERALLAPPPWVFALVLGAGAFAISAWVGLVVLQGRPILLDGVSQLVQARYLGAGRVAGPRLELPEFWQFQFMVANDAGWTSQYPPGFAALLAVAQRVLPLPLVGPLLLGGAVALTSLVAARLFPGDLAEDRARGLVVARLGAALAAVSPFLAFHAAAYMSHVLALLLIAAAMLASLRAAHGSWPWSLLAGAAVGACFATRPYTAVVLGFVAVVLVWTLHPEGRPPARARWLRHLGAAAAGALPFVMATLLYNRRVFGALTRFGYVAGEGPGHALGFHVDPWGDPYGPRQALGYTAADLQGLSLDLLESPVPAAVVVGLYLLLARRLSNGARLASAWALLPVAAQALYWHHDLFMGPRLLYESAPGWCLLFAGAIVGAAHALPERPPSRWAPRRGGVIAAFLVALVVTLGWAAPAKLASYRTVAARSGMAFDPPAVSAPALVFVHGAWEDRLAARLAATGMRIDSIRMALRSSSSCEIEHALEGADADPAADRPTGVTVRARLAFTPRPETPLRAMTMPSGSVVRARPGERMDAACEREATSDVAGALGLPPFLWRGDLPDLGAGRPMFVRDLGPERNARLIARMPEREPRTLLYREGEVRLVPYEEGMRELWAR